MIKRVLYLWIILAMIVAGCARPEVDVPAAPKSPETGRADVEQIEVMVWESLPALVSVTATGNLPDGCTKIDQVNVEQVGNRFEVEITTRLASSGKYLSSSFLYCTQAWRSGVTIIALNPCGATFSVKCLAMSSTIFSTRSGDFKNADILADF